MTYQLESLKQKQPLTVNEFVETFPMQEMLGLNQARQRNRDKLVNKLAKLSLLDEHVAMEERKLTEARYKFSCRRLAVMLRDLEDERSSYLKAGTANGEVLRGQISCIRETISHILNEDTMLAKLSRILFTEQGITIASIISAFWFIIITLVLALTGGSAPPVVLTHKSSLKEWVKQTNNNNNNKPAEAFDHLASTILAEKVAAALSGVIGTVVAWFLKIVGSAVGWLVQNLGKYCGSCWPACCLLEVISHSCCEHHCNSSNNERCLLVSVMLTVSLVSWHAFWHPTLLQNNRLWLNWFLWDN